MNLVRNSQSRVFTKITVITRGVAISNLVRNLKLNNIRVYISYNDIAYFFNHPCPP